MIKIRRSEERGYANHGWLESRHSFSFANYYDPENMGFRSLRVINEDWIGPQGGFGTHPHRDMEIITYVVSGQLEHHDSMGNGSVLRSGDVQRMTAGSGVQHSEVNPSADESLHLLQIWIVPQELGLAPGYEETNLSDDDKRGRLSPVVTGGDEGGMLIHQDVSLLASVLVPGEPVVRDLASGRHAWVQVVRGSVTVNGAELGAGDAVAVSEEKSLTIAAISGEAEVLVFDLA
jgi:redox-sensitive bicupin YhaK (pirin superfamily)